MHNQKAVDGFEGARRVTQTIGMHVKNMTAAELDHALNVWDSLLKSGLTRSPNNVTTAEASVDNQEEVEPMEKSRNDALMARGRAFVRHGYTPREAAKLALEVERKTGLNRQAPAPAASTQKAKAKQPEAEPKTHLRWGATPGAWGNDRLMVEDSAPVMPRAPQVAPQQATRGIGPEAWGYEKKDISKLTGHQQAALKVGVDLDKTSAAELARMDRTQMETLARQQLLEEVAEQHNRQLASRPVQDSYLWGSPPSLGQRR